MKKKSIIQRAGLSRVVFVLTILISSFSFANAAEITMTKSYFQKETGGGGQVPIVPDNLSEVVYFYDNGLIKLKLKGTVWKFQGKNIYGLLVFSFVRNEGIIMPGESYQNLLMAPNYSNFQVNYVFGIMGMYTPMCKIYTYLGEGEQMAYDWQNN